MRLHTPLKHLRTTLAMLDGYRLFCVIDDGFGSSGLVSFGSPSALMHIADPRWLYATNFVGQPSAYSGPSYTLVTCQK